MHKPVMLDQVLNLSRGLSFAPKLIWDATFGRGGHTRALLATFPDAKIMATDRDPEALIHGAEAFRNEIAENRIQFNSFNFHKAHSLESTGFFTNSSAQKSEQNADHKFDLILLDLGVSSPQLDSPGRGFSFYHDGPLDMRMDPTQGISAGEVVNTFTEDGLARVFQELGEIGRPHRVVKAILNDRKIKPFTTTSQLAGLIERVEGWHKKGRHPATQFFLALRLLVNDELEGLSASLPTIMEKALGPGGRLLVITFHSLEDRIVKNIFKNSELGRPVNKKVIIPERTEILDNPRSRSAKLRVFERGTVNEIFVD
jgi:16S rRNA (cytosine1402-N4)-methyltransferase